jgi:hypothetical protein
MTSEKLPAPSKPDNVVVQCILFPEDKCNASI